MPKNQDHRFNSLNKNMCTRNTQNKSISLSPSLSYYNLKVQANLLPVLIKLAKFLFKFQITLVVEWELKDQNGADIFCIQLPAQIID